MINTNLYNKGYQDGRNQGKENLPKDYRGMITWKTLFFGNHPMDTYIQGFDIGYLDGLRERNNPNQSNNNSSVNSNNNIISSNLNNSSNMQRGIDGQIDLLKQMEQFLNNMKDSLNDMVKTHQSFLASLDSEGIDVKLYQQFDEYFLDNKKNLEDLIKNIDDEDIPYTKKIIDYLEHTPR